MFSKKTKRMNEQLEIRKHLLNENKDWRAVVKFPSILLIKKPGDASNFKNHLISRRYANFKLFILPWYTLTVKMCFIFLNYGTIVYTLCLDVYLSLTDIVLIVF